MTASLELPEPCCSLRTAAKVLALKSRELLPILEERGVRLLRFGNRLRVPIAAIRALAADSVELTREDRQAHGDWIRIESVRQRRGDEAAEEFAARIARRRGQPAPEAPR